MLIVIWYFAVVFFYIFNGFFFVFFFLLRNFLKKTFLDCVVFIKLVGLSVYRIPKCNTFPEKRLECSFSGFFLNFFFLSRSSCFRSIFSTRISTDNNELGSLIINLIEKKKKNRLLPYDSDDHCLDRNNRPPVHSVKFLTSL